MWFLGGLWRALRGMWRLLIGLVIGAVLYVWVFFTFKDLWENTHHQVTKFMDWLVQQPLLADYSQWNTLLNLDDKLTFALYIMVGRLIWLVIEDVFFVFPHWLIFGRQKKNPDSGAIAGADIKMGGSSPAKAAVAAVTAGAVAADASGEGGGSAPNIQQLQAEAQALSSQPATGLVAAMEKAATGELPAGSKELDRNVDNLERSIDQALEQIRQGGESDKVSRS